MKYRTITAALLALVLATGVFADTIRLKDGSTIKGRIVAFSGGKFIIAVGEGSRRREITLTAGEVESIEFDRNSEGRVAAEKPAEPAVTRTAPVDESVPVAQDTDRAYPSVVPPQSVRTSTAGSSIQPIVLNVRVLADNTANGWTHSGWVVKRGQRIKIVGSGEISLGKGHRTAPSGLPALEDAGKLLRGVPTGALIAVIGDDNNDFIYIGAEREFIATRDGSLFLGVNEAELRDNSGSFQVRIEILPG